jgi:GNAT superfamily N-acetyltransferase
MVNVRAAVLADWQVFRDIRLEALRSAPSAFGSSYADEVTRDEAFWRGRSSGGNIFLAYLGDRTGETAGPGPAGLAGGYQPDPVTVELVSMFVRPAARGLGVGEALVAAVIGWARTRQATSVHLWVTETNAAARKLYERCGFTPTAERQPLPSDPSLSEIAMTLPLDSAPGPAGPG